MALSEIADWHDEMADHAECAKRKDFHRQAAATIRAQAEALKIATEALPDLIHVVNWLEAGCDAKHAATELRIYQDRITRALARIKEV